MILKKNHQTTLLMSSLAPLAPASPVSSYILLPNDRTLPMMTEGRHIFYLFFSKCPHFFADWALFCLLSDPFPLPPRCVFLQSSAGYPPSQLLSWPASAKSAVPWCKQCGAEQLEQAAHILMHIHTSPL